MSSPMTPVQSEAGDKKDKADDSKPANSSTAPIEQKADEQAKSGVTVDHGEKSEEHRAAEKAAEQDAKDPWGNTPVQMREGVEGQDPPGGRTTHVDGLNPHLQEFPEGEEVTGGTLPPA